MSFVLIYKGPRGVNFSQGETAADRRVGVLVAADEYQVPFWLGRPSHARLHVPCSA